MMDTFTYYDMVIYAARDSHSARSISTQLGCRRWREGLYSRYSRRRPFFRGNSSPLIINWGSTIRPIWLEDRRFKITPRYLNPFDKIAVAIDKLKFFEAITDYNSHNDKHNRIQLLKWTSSVEDVQPWLDGGHQVVVRKTTKGSAGRGIRVLSPQNWHGRIEDIEEAPLYTRYYPKTHEFRIHVFNGQVIDFTEKKAKEGVEVDRVVRNHDNGWVHAHNVTPMFWRGRAAIEDASVASVKALGLDFGAVDVLAVLGPFMNEGPTPDDAKREVVSFKVCEVNTAPGLENTSTIEAYSKAIIKFYEGN